MPNICPYEIYRATEQVEGIATPSSDLLILTELWAVLRLWGNIMEDSNLNGLMDIKSRG